MSDSGGKWTPFIERLLQTLDKDSTAKHITAGGAQSRRARITESVVEALCTEAHEVFAQESNLIQVPSPVNICGDIHGQLRDLVRFFDKGVTAGAVWAHV